MRGQACDKVMRHKVGLLRLLCAGRGFNTLHLCAGLGMVCPMPTMMCASVEVGNRMWTTNRIAWCHEAVMSGRVLRMAICVRLEAVAGAPVSRYDETNKRDHVACLL